MSEVQGAGTGLGGQVPQEGAAESPAAAFPNPVFVGGAGRSGTTVMGRLVGAHPRYHMIRGEVQFHTKALPALLERRMSLARFMNVMRTKWWQRDVPYDETAKRGLSRILEREQYDSALGEFESSYAQDPLGSARRLMHSLLDPLAAEAGKPAWVEMTPPTVTVASVLGRVFPNMKLVHMVRDGRDVASSVVQRPWGASSVPEAIHWWADTLRKAEASTKEVPSERILVMPFEELVADRREESYQRLLDFLELEDEPEMRQFFEKRMRPERANIGRWQAKATATERAEIAALYDEVVDGLHRDGISCAPARGSRRESEDQPRRRGSTAGVEAPGPDSRANPVFVGGSGRSGTTVVARLIGSHSRYHMIPGEVEFHTKVMPKLLEGNITLQEFIDAMRRKWWRRIAASDGKTVRGLSTIVSQDEHTSALARFEATFEQDPLGSSRELVRSLLDPVAARAGKPGWVEMTPPTVRVASLLSKVLPDMKMVHMVRDGRDVGSSAIEQPWSPGPTVADGMHWWAARLREAESSAREAPPGRILVMQLEDLVLERREEYYERLLDFLELEDEPGMREFFEKRMTPERANIGRWQAETSEAERVEIAALYDQMLADLHRDGISCAPTAPVSAPERVLSGDSHRGAG